MMRTLVASLLLAALALPSSGATVIKLGSLAPTGSPWDNGLKKINAEWTKLSNGQVTLKIYAGGIVGDEMDMIRKMRLGQLQAAGISGIGLCRILPTILNIQAPLFVRTDAELAYVLDKMRPAYEKGLEEKGFKILAWNLVGWAHFFSKSPVIHPTDLQKHKLFVWAGDADAIQAWKEMGFRPIPLQMTDLMSSLQSGMVDAFTGTSLSAASYQWFGMAPNMCGMNWAPVLGGIVVSVKTWESLPADLRPKLQAVTELIGASMQDEIKKADADAVGIMKQYGLKVSAVPPQVEEEWGIQVRKGTEALYGTSLDKVTLDMIKGYLQEFRSKQGK